VAVDAALPCRLIPGTWYQVLPDEKTRILRAFRESASKGRINLADSPREALCGRLQSLVF